MTTTIDESEGYGRYDAIIDNVPNKWGGTSNEDEVTFQVMVYDHPVLYGERGYSEIFIGMYGNDGKKGTVHSRVPLEDAETFAYAILAGVNNARRFQESDK